MSNARPDFDSIIDTNSPRLFNLLYRLSGNYHTAQDLTQEVFLIAFREYGKFQGRSEVFTWLYRIALNHFRRHYRLSRVRSWLGLEEVGESAAALEMDDRLEQDQRSQAIDRALAALPVDFRTVLSLFYFEERDCAAIAGLLNCSEGTVKSRLWRGRQLMAKKLKGFVAETGV